MPWDEGAHVAFVVQVQVVQVVGVGVVVVVGGGSSSSIVVVVVVLFVVVIGRRQWCASRCLRCYYCCCCCCCCYCCCCCSRQRTCSPFETQQRLPAPAAHANLTRPNPGPGPGEEPTVPFSGKGNKNPKFKCLATSLQHGKARSKSRKVGCLEFSCAE